MEIRIEGYDLPGRSCAGDGNFPGYDNIHVGVQRRNHRDELLGLTAGDADSAVWTFEGDAVETAAGLDWKGPYVQGRPRERFIYLSWGTVDKPGAFEMFRRAKLWLDAVDAATVTTAIRTGVLVGRVRLTDAKGHPLCASVRPPLIEWSA